MQISVSSTLTVYHDGQFWVGLAEHVEDGRYGAARIVFGAEPSDEEILRFVVNKWAKLSFFGDEATEASKPAKSPKRRAREAAKALKRPAVSTKAQQALVAQREAMKQESAHARSRRRAEEADARFELCFRERGCPCPSFYDYAESLRGCRWASRFRPAIFRRAAHMALEEFATVTNVGRPLAAALVPSDYSVPIACAGSRAGGRGSTRIVDSVPRSRRRGRRSAMP